MARCSLSQRHVLCAAVRSVLGSTSRFTAGWLVSGDRTGFGYCLKKCSCAVVSPGQLLPGAGERWASSVLLPRPPSGALSFIKTVPQSMPLGESHRLPVTHILFSSSCFLSFPPRSHSVVRWSFLSRTPRSPVNLLMSRMRTCGARPGPQALGARVVGNELAHFWQLVKT